MPKTLEQIISSHEILSQIFISCKSLPDEGKFTDALTELKEIVPEYRNVTKDHLVTPKEETALEEKLLLVSARMIEAISKSQNGIVLNNNGEIDAERSLEQAKKNGNEVLPEVQYAASKEIMKELWNDRVGNMPELKPGENVFEYAMRALNPGEDYSSILKLLASNYDREINEPRSFSVGNDYNQNYNYNELFNVIIKEMNVEEELKDDETGEKTQAINQTARNKVIMELLKSPEFKLLKAYRESLTASWLNDEQSVYLLNAIKFCINAEEAKENGSSDLEKMEKERDNYLKKHPEFANELFGEDGKVTEKCKEAYFKYSYGLTKTKIIDQIRKDAQKDEFPYSKETDARKAEYLRISLLALGDNDESVKRLGIERLSAIENKKRGFKLIHEVTDKDGNTSVLLDPNAFLDEYNKVAKTRYTDIQEFYNDAIKFQEKYVAGKTLKMLDKEASEGKLEKLNFDDMEQAIKKMEELRWRENVKETIPIKTFSSIDKVNQMFGVTSLEKTKKVKFVSNDGKEVLRRSSTRVMRKDGITIKNREDIPQLKKEKSTQDETPNQDNVISLIDDNEIEQTFGLSAFVKDRFQDDEIIIDNSNLGEINVDSKVLEQMTTIMAETDTDKDNAVKMTEQELADFLLKNSETLNYDYITLPADYSQELLDNFEYTPVDTEAINGIPLTGYEIPVNENEYTAEFAYSADSLEVSEIQADKNVFNSQNLSAENVNEKDSSDEKTNENDENEKKSFLDKWKKRISLIGEKVKPIIANVMNTIKGTKYLGSGDGEGPKPSGNDVVLKNTLEGYIVTQDQLTPMTQVRAENMQKRSKEGQNLDAHDDHEEQAG